MNYSPHLVTQNYEKKEKTKSVFHGLKDKKKDSRQKRSRQQLKKKLPNRFTLHQQQQQTTVTTTATNIQLMKKINNQRNSPFSL